HAMAYYEGSLEIARMLAGARLDETELAVVSLVLLVLSARQFAQLPDDSPLASLMNEVFRSLKKHYEQNYKDVVLRLDSIIQLAHEIQASSQH
ncbi:hypothetical protein AAVH_37592, partial [Aphelenchoides avenae]